MPHFAELDVTSLPRGQKGTDWLDVAGRADGGLWRLPFLYVMGENTGPTLTVVAGVHGDEYEGVEAIPQVFAQVQPSDLRGTLLMLPVCNMPAYESALRSSPIDGLNLARVFPGEREGSVTQRIAYWMTEKLLKHADFFIDLHSAGITGSLPTLIGYIHSEGDLGQRSLAAARAFGAPVLWGHPLPLPPGRTISAATDLGVPSLYTEAAGGGRVLADDLACYRDGVLNVMKHLGMLAGEPQPRPATHHLVGDGNLDHIISAPVAGYFKASVRLLDEVAAGQQLGAICDFFGQVVAELIADHSGIVIMLRGLPRVHVGDGLVHLTNKFQG